MLAILTDTIMGSDLFDYKLRDFLVKLTELLVTHQHVTHQARYYLAKIGLATGLTIGVFLANIYLNQLDDYLLKCTNAMNIEIKCMKRLVDDIFLIIRKSQLEAVVNLANSWHPSIQCELAGSGRCSIPFLDVAISIDNQNRIDFSIYRKPTATYH